MIEKENYFLFISYKEPITTSIKSIVFGKISIQKDILSIVSKDDKYKRILVNFLPKENNIVFLTGLYCIDKDSCYLNVEFDNIFENKEEALNRKIIIDSSKGRDLINNKKEFYNSFIYFQAIILD